MKKGFALTMQYNESDFLPQWIEHYSKYYNRNQLYVIDHGSDSNFIPNDINRIYVPRSKIFDEDKRRDCVKGVVFSLMQYYDFGIFSDIDELINLDGFDPNQMEKNQVYYVYGFDLFRVIVGDEHKIYGRLNSSECKPLIFNHPLPQWSSGFHGCIINGRPNFKMVMGHTKYLERHRYENGLVRRARVYESMSDLHKNAGVAKHWVYENSIDDIYKKMQSEIDNGFVYNSLPDLSNFIVNDYAGHSRVKDLSSPYVLDLSTEFADLL